MFSTTSLHGQRQQWSNPGEFILSCVCMAVGLGSIWRFPLMAYENGGGAFLLAFLIVLIIAGRALYVLDLALGQFSSRGNIKLFSSLGRGFAGLGVSQTICSICVSTYYSTVIALSLFYFVNCFQAQLPWSYCRPEWGETCIGSISNEVGNENNYTSSAELFFSKYVLNEIDNIDDGIGLPDWRLALCLLLSWMASSLILIEGIETSKKAYYFLVFFPYIILFIILGIACGMEGALNGMYFFLSPVWSKLLDITVWFNAISQSFFSLGMGLGTIIIFASYSEFDTDINSVAFIVTIVVILTSILCGMTIFSVLGHLAAKLNVEIEQVVHTGGMGLLYITYPTAIIHIKFAPQMLSIAFFLMIFILGLGSLIGFHQIVNAQILDFNPKLKHWQVAVITSCAGFLLSLPFITPGGMFIFTLVDNFCVSMILYVVTTVETVTVIYLYGLQNICWDVEFMVKEKVGPYLRISWGIIVPAVLAFIYLYYLATFKGILYKDVKYPTSAVAIGWLIFLVGIAPIPVNAAYQVFKRRSLGCPEMFKKTFSSENWGPVELLANNDWNAFKALEKEKWEERRGNRCVSCLQILADR